MASLVKRKKATASTTTSSKAPASTANPASMQYVHRQAKAACSDLSMEQLIEELQHIQKFILLYPRQGEKGPDRAAYVLSKQTLAQ